MNSKTLIAAAVAATCGWPLFAAAERDTTHSMGAGQWDFATPSSANETGTWAPAEMGGVYVSLPNPQTPWTANETGPLRYAEEMSERREHIASVEQARLAAASFETEQLASASASETGTVIGTSAPESMSSAESSASVADSSSVPAEPGDSERVAAVSPLLMDTREPGMSSELALQSEGMDAASAEPSAFAGEELDSSAEAALAGEDAAADAGTVASSAFASSANETGPDAGML